MKHKGYTKKCKKRKFINEIRNYHSKSNSLVINFHNIRATLYTIYGRFVLSCCIFFSFLFVDADLLQLSLYLYDVSDASTSFQCCIQCC